MNEQSFSRKVARLNTNILYLCYTQRVKLSTLSPNHTLENISKLLDGGELGRIGPVDASDGFSGPQHNQLMQNLNAGNTDSGSDDEGIIITLTATIHHSLSINMYTHCVAHLPFIHIPDDGTLPIEWEAVQHPHQPPDLALPSISQNPQQTASVAGGFVSSAVQSIWRALTTGNRPQ